MSSRRQALPVLPGIDITRQEVFDVLGPLAAQVLGFRIQLTMQHTARWGNRWMVSVGGQGLVCGAALSRYQAVRPVGLPHGDDIEMAIYRAAWELVDLILLEVKRPVEELFPAFAA